ncbi:unnamed protein product [Arabis nemorensis]|uniref:RNase H type-1 domain-containing protein n=1 Tax=Arabis nemorensis TaxID=586526 RepID=A0A565CLH5_9BRAS|nr:unnamed protein product [Arabis nemorensis]
MAQGIGRWYGAKAYPLLLSSLEAEATALIWAMMTFNTLGFKEVTFESDSKLLVRAIRDPKSCPRPMSFTEKINGQWGSLKPHCNDVNREASGVADTIAKRASSLPICYASLERSIPNRLSPIVEREKLNVISINQSRYQ